MAIAPGYYDLAPGGYANTPGFVNVGSGGAPNWQLQNQGAYNAWLQAQQPPVAPPADVTGAGNPTGGITNPTSAPNWSIEDSWIPGAQEATQIFNQGLPPLDPNNYLGGLASDIAGGNPFMNALASSRRGPFANLLAGVDTTNPAAGQLMGVDPSNPYAGQLGGIDTGNPFLSQFQNFASQMNPYADQLFDIGADKIRDRINSQFGMAGQGNSALNLDTQLADLSDFGAQFYGGIYDRQQDRLLDAMSRGADVFSTGVGQEIDALSRGGQLYGTAAGQGIDALAQGGSLYGSGVGQRIGALGDAGSLYDQGEDRRLTGLQSAANAFNQSQTLGATALPSILGLQQDQPWSNLRNYADIVSQLTGTSPQQPNDPRTSGFDRAIGLMSMLGAFA